MKYFSVNKFNKNDIQKILLKGLYKKVYYTKNSVQKVFIKNYFKKQSYEKNY